MTTHTRTACFLFAVCIGTTYACVTGGFDPPVPMWPLEYARLRVKVAESYHGPPHGAAMQAWAWEGQLLDANDAWLFNCNVSVSQISPQTDTVRMLSPSEHNERFLLLEVLRDSVQSHPGVWWWYTEHPRITDHEVMTIVVGRITSRRPNRELVELGGFATTQVFGPYVFLSGKFGTYRRMLAHELGHIFGAVDVGDPLRLMTGALDTIYAVGPGTLISHTECEDAIASQYTTQDTTS